MSMRTYTRNSCTVTLQPRPFHALVILYHGRREVWRRRLSRAQALTWFWRVVYWMKAVSSAREATMDNDRADKVIFKVRHWVREGRGWDEAHTIAEMLITTPLDSYHALDSALRAVATQLAQGFSAQYGQAVRWNWEDEEQGHIVDVW